MRVSAAEDLAAALRLADEEARYDAAEAALEGLLDGPQGAQAALELAGLYERVGDIEAAAEMVAAALARGQFPEPEAQRLESRLERCRRQRIGITRFPVSVEAATRIREIEALLEARRWPAAFAGLREVLEKFEGTFIPGPGGQYLGLRAWARAVLEPLGDDARRAYAEESRKRWEEALADGSEDAYRRFLRLFPGPEAGVPAFLAWADTLADGGSAERAAGLLSRADLPADRTKERLRRLGLQLRPGVEAGPIVDAGLAAGAGRIEAAAAGSWPPGSSAPRRFYVPREPYERIRNPRRLWAGAIDPPRAVPSPAGVFLVEIFHHGDPEKVDSVVTCFDRESGAVRWSLAGDPLFESLRVSSDPVESGGTVFVTAATRAEFPEFWICALDANDGHLLWRKRVGVGATAISCLGRGALHAGRSGPTLLCAGETIYYATQMGSVVAFDRDLGEPLWALSYSRVSRVGPRSGAPLALLERRTQGIRLTPNHLVILPRDLNGILIVDRASGKLERTIRSLELVELLEATDAHIVAKTLSGEIRTHATQDGRILATRRAPADSTPAQGVPGKAAVSPPVLVAKAQISSIADGSKGPRGVDEPGGPPGVDVLGATERSSVPAPRHEAFFPGHGIAAAWAGTNRPVLVLAAPSGPGSPGSMSAFAPDDGYRRLWWSPFDIETGVWAASSTSSPGGGGARSLLALSDDRETVRIVDAVTGSDRAAAKDHGVVPLREIHWIGETAVLAGTSRLAAWAAGRPAAQGNKSLADLPAAWSRDFSPCNVKGVFPHGDALLVFTQVSGPEPARLLCLDPGSGETRRSFILVAPVVRDANPWEGDPRDRFPVRRVAYGPGDLEPCAGGWTVKRGGETVTLFSCPLRILEVARDRAVVELADYRGLVALESGSVTLVSPLEKSPEASSDAERALFDWLRTHSGYEREGRSRLAWEEGGLRLAWGSPPPAFPGRPEGRGGSFSALVDSAGRAIPLAGMEPTRIDESMDPLRSRILVVGLRGVLVLCRAPVGAPAGCPPGKGAPPGKAPADLFDPPGARLEETPDLTLDGDLSDWPGSGWLPLSRARHAWPPCGTASDHSPHDETRAMFRWARDSTGVWLAVKVSDEIHSFSGTPLAGRGDAVDVLLAGILGAYPDGTRRDNEAGASLVLSLLVVEEAPLVIVRSAGRPPSVGRSAGLGSAQKIWLSRRYGWEPPEAQGIAVAAARDGGITSYELHVDARLLLPPSAAASRFSPRGFDIRIVESDGPGATTSLEWGGALLDPEAFTPALFLGD